MTTRNGKLPLGKIALGGGAAIGLIIMITIVAGGLGVNDSQNWQILQSVGGEMTVRDEAGWYLKKFARVWTYPRAVQVEYKGEGGITPSVGDQSIRTTFNDGGESWMSTLVRFATPRTAEARMRAHKEFGGSEQAIVDSVHAHLVNCLKATAPLMSASEHQSARKAEFTQLVDSQLREGIYKMRKVEKTLLDETDADGRAIKVFATEIIADDEGKPLIAQVSPLKEYDIQILQFSVTKTNYDAKTREKFEAKKDSFLKAEQAKAEREEEVQQRLMIIERGRRELAEVQAQSNKEKEEATIKADREKEVAEIQAAQRVAVAEQTKVEAETKASQLVSVAKLKEEQATIMARAAAKEAEATRLLAEAEEYRITKGGAITERDRILAEYMKERDVAVAAELSKIQVPATMLLSGGSSEAGGGEGHSLTASLVNLRLLQSAGLLQPALTANNVQPTEGGMEVGMAVD